MRPSTSRSTIAPLPAIRRDGVLPMPIRLDGAVRAANEQRRARLTTRNAAGKDDDVGAGAPDEGRGGQDPEGAGVNLP